MNLKTKTKLTTITAALASLALAPGALAAKSAPKPVALRVSAPAQATAATPFNATVSAVTKQGKTAKDFHGRVVLSIPGGDAVVPAAHTYSKADKGRYTFRGIELSSAGQRTISARAGKLAGSASTSVAGGQVASIELSAPDSVDAGAEFTVSTVARDAKGNVVGADATIRMSGGDCAGGGSCRATSAGEQVIHASVGDVSDEQILTVKPGAPANLTLKPKSLAKVLPASIDVTNGWLYGNNTSFDSSRAFTITAADAWGNPLGDVTNQASVSVDGKACPNAVCAGTVPGDRTVSASYSNARGTASIPTVSYDEAFNIQCRSEWDDMNGTVTDGCEHHNDYAGYSTYDTARDLGAKSCNDKDSRLDDTMQLVRDHRSANGDNPYAGSTLYWQVKGTGGWCVNDLEFDLQISGGKTDDKCYEVRVWRGNQTTEYGPTPVVRMSGEETARIGNYWYQDGERLNVSVRDVCGGERAISDVRLTGHL